MRRVAEVRLHGCQKGRQQHSAQQGKYGRRDQHYSLRIARRFCVAHEQFSIAMQNKCTWRLADILARRARVASISRCAPPMVDAAVQVRPLYPSTLSYLAQRAVLICRHRMEELAPESRVYRPVASARDLHSRMRLRKHVNDITWFPGDQGHRSQPTSRSAGFARFC